MIKINLLGDEPEAPINSIIALSAYIGTVALTLICWIVSSFLLSGSISDSSERLQFSQIQLNSLKDKTKEVDELKKTKDELQNVTLVLAVLRRSQQGPVKLLDDINQSTPDNIWITSIDSKVDRMKVHALALEDSQIADFIQSLRKSSLIPEAELTDRRTVPLLQINSYNSFSGDQTKRVVSGDKSQLSSVFNEIKKEAESAGLNFANGIPDSSLRDSVAVIGNPADGGVTKLSFSDIKSKARTGGGRPTIYAWESLQEVKGLSFMSDLKVRYDDSGVDLESLINSLQVKQEEQPKDNGKKKSKNQE
jgi:Tfp pilus assembly protein PilN